MLSNLLIINFQKRPHSSIIQLAATFEYDILTWLMEHTPVQP